MKYSGRARASAVKLIVWTLVGLLVIFFAGFVATIVGAMVSAISATLILLWVLFVLFTLYFFRDPNPQVPREGRLAVSPAHGKIDKIDEIEEPQYMGGRCRRISIFLSVFDIHVQNAPVSGRIAYLKYTEGQFLNALNSESASQNENVMIGIETPECPGEKIGVKLIAGLIARRIVPFIAAGDTTARGERISLIQFGSRTDLYLPLSAKIRVQLGDRAVGGETVMATFD